MKSPDVIDAEFEVVSDPRPKPLVTWTFWADDFPNLAGLAGGFAALFGLAAIFHHWF